MKWTCSTILLLVLCSGCANQNTWVHDSKSTEEMQRDFRECQYDSKKSSFVPFGNGTSPISAGMQEGFQSVSLMNDCMASRGFYLTNRQELEDKKARNKQAIDEYSLANKNKDYRRALEIVNRLISENPNSSGLYYDRGMINYVTEKYNEAVIDYNKAISLNFKNPDVYVFKSQAFLQLGEYDIALEAINYAIEIKSSWSSLSTKAYILNKRGEYDKALEFSNKAISADSRVPQPYKNRGLAYLGKGEFDKAIEQFNKAITLDPKYSYSYLGRGDTFMKLGKAESADADYKKGCEYGDKESCDKVASK